MADIGELTIKVQVAAEEAEAQLDALVQRMQTFGTDAESAVQSGASLGDAVKQAMQKATESTVQTESTFARMQESGTRAMDGIRESTAQTAETAQTMGDTVQQVTDQVTGGITKQVAKTVEATKQTGVFKTLLEGIGTGVAMGATNALITLAVNGVGALITKLINLKAEQEAAEKAEREAHQKTADALSEKQQGLQQLQQRYQDLMKKGYLSSAETSEMAQLQSQLASEYGVTAGAVDDLTGSYDRMSAAIKTAMQLQAQQRKAAMEQTAGDSYTQFAQATEELYKKKNEQQQKQNQLTANYTQYLEAVASLQTRIQEIATRSGISDSDRADMLAGLGAEMNTLQFAFSGVDDEIADGEKTIKGYNEQLEAMNGNYEQWLSNKLALDKAKSIGGGGEWSDEIANALRTQLTLDLTQFDTQEQAKNYIDSVCSAIVDAATNADVDGLLDELSGWSEQINDGLLPSKDEYDKAQESYASLMSIIVSALESYDMSAEQAKAVAMGLMDSLGVSPLIGQSYEALGTSMSAVAFDNVAALQKQTDKLNNTIGNLTSVKKNITEWNKAKKTFDDAKKSGKGVNDAFAGLTKAGSDLKVNLDAGTGSMEDMNKAADQADAQVQSMADGVQTSGEEMYSTLNGILGQAVELQNQLSAQMAMGGVDVSGPLAAIAQVINAVNAMLAALAQGGITPQKTSGGGGGGGGGNKKTAYDEAIADMEHMDKLGKLTAKQALALLEQIGASVARTAEEELDWQERIHEARERLRKEQIEADYDMIAHKKAMGELTLEEELALLEKIRKNRQLNADEQLKIEEELYAAKQDIRQRDAESIDRVSDGLQQALQNRYQAMLDTETEHLDDSRKAWQTWSDESVAAIQAQIDALDDLSSQEDNEAKDAAELRKIAKLQQDIQFEQDAYNRAKLTQQLEQALESRETRLNKLAISQQKEALQAQIDAVQQEAQREQDALDEQQAAIEAAYAEQMSAAAIQAEAQQMLIANNQQEIINLIGTYAPDYNVAGETLGEQLVDGFTTQVGSIEKWFDRLADRIAEAQKKIAETAVAAAGSLYDDYNGRTNAPVVVEQTVNINQPVETPSETARRIAKANEELGRVLQQAL